MGKEPADTFLPHRADYRTVAVLYMSDVLLTWMVGGLGSIINYLHHAFYDQCFLHVVSLHPPGSEPAIDVILRTVSPTFTLVVEGVGEYEVPTSTVKYAWALSAPFLLILVLESGLSSSSCPTLRLLLWLTPRSRIGVDSVQSIAIS
jgi:hypothetical protein